jgi:hypothetical protein
MLVVLLAATRNYFLETVLRSSSWLGAVHVPSPRALLYRLKQWSSEGLLELAIVHLNEAVLREARRRRRLPPAAMAAIDYTDTQYYGRTNRGPCCRGEEKRGTTWFHRTAALSLVIHGSRYTIAWTKVTPLTSHKAVVESLLDGAEKWVRVTLLAMDRGLYSAAVQQCLKERGVRVLVAVPKWRREREVVARCKGKKWIAEPWKMGGVPGWTIIVADNAWLREELKDRREEEGHSVWVTDLPFHNDPLPFVRAYNRRWSIENAFQEEDRFQPRTKSPDAGVRFAFLLLGLVLRNLWVLLRRDYPGLTTFLMKDVLHKQCSVIIEAEGSGDGRRVLTLATG